MQMLKVGCLIPSLLFQTYFASISLGHIWFQDTAPVDGTLNLCHETLIAHEKESNLFDLKITDILAHLRRFLGSDQMRYLRNKFETKVGEWDTLVYHAGFILLLNSEHSLSYKKVFFA